MKTENTNMNSGSKMVQYHRRDGKAHSEDGLQVGSGKKKRRVRVCFVFLCFIYCVVRFVRDKFA